LLLLPLRGGAIAWAVVITTQRSAAGPEDLDTYYQAIR